MNGLELNNLKQDIIDQLSQQLKEDLYAIIVVGGFGLNKIKIEWSDIDLLIVVNESNLDIKFKIGQQKDKLEQKYSMHFGISFITKEELLNPKYPEFTYEGKNLQALLELKLDPSRLIFSRDKIIDKIYFPSSEDIKKYSLSNIAMFRLRNRRSLTEKTYPKDAEKLKKILAKEIRAAFIITKLAVQYFALKTCFDNKDLINKATKLFSDFDLRTIKSNLDIIDQWHDFNDKEKILKYLESTDQYIEKFSDYVFKKASQQ